MTKEKKPVEIEKKDAEENSEEIINAAVQFINEKAQRTLYEGSIVIGTYTIARR